MYANELVDEADMMGTGKEGTNHIIFDGADGGLYRSDAQGMGSAQTMLTMIQYYNYLGIQQNVEKLNLQAIVSMGNSPYAKKFETLGIKIDNGVLQNKGAWKLVRSAIMFKLNGTEPTKVVESFYYVDKAMKVGSNMNQNSADRNRVQEIINNIKDRKYSQEEMKQIFSELEKLGVNIR